MYVHDVRSEGSRSQVVSLGGIQLSCGDLQVMSSGMLVGMGMCSAAARRFSNAERLKVEIIQDD